MKKRKFYEKLQMQIHDFLLTNYVLHFVIFNRFTDTDIRKKCFSVTTSKINRYIPKQFCSVTENYRNSIFNFC